MQKGAVWVISFLLLVIPLGVYSPVLSHEFLDYDDPAYVTSNPVVRRGLTADGWRWAWTSFDASNWHPLTWLSHMLDCQLFPPSRPGAAAWHHLVNLLFHLANTLLLFHVLRGLTGATWRSAFVAALFALHPLHVESVAWVAERKDVLSTFFGLLALAAYGRYARRPRPLAYGLLLAAFALSLLAKPMLVTLPAVLLLLDYWPLRRFPAREAEPGDGGPRPTLRFLLLEKAPLAALSAASCVMTVLAQSDTAIISLKRIPLGGRLVNTVTAYAAYLGKTVWPADLAVFYPHPAVAWFPGRSLTLGEWACVVGASLLLAGVTGLAVALRRRRPALLVGWLWFLGTLVPVIGLLQVGLQSMADRYTYFPLIGIFIALAWSVPERWGASPRLRIALAAGAAAVLAACAVLTSYQLATWQDTPTLWEHALRVTTNNAEAHFHLGAYFYNQGRFQEGADHLRRAAELDPDNGLILNDLGLIRLEEGKDDEALDLLTRAAAAAPRIGVYQNGLGLALARKGRMDEAARAFAEAVRLSPQSAEPYFNLAAVEDDQSDHAAAAGNYTAGLKRDPDWPWAACRRTEALLGRDDPARRCPAEALWRARQADAATDGRHPEIQEVLAAAFAANGRAAEAAATARRALNGTGPNSDPDFVRRLQAEARHYQADLDLQSNPVGTP